VITYKIISKQKSQKLKNENKFTCFKEQYHPV
jgi:hypothetical protein